MKKTITIILIFTAFFANAQTNLLQINPQIILPKDSVESKNLIASLNSFLTASQKPNEENNFVFPEQKVNTFLLLNEMKNIEKSARFNNDYFFKPYLTNVAKLDENRYLIQVSFIGVNENEALLRASFSFIAHKINNSFLFASPLSESTENWKTLKTGNLIFHYKNSINENQVNSYKKLASLFDKKLNLTKNTTEFYCCENLMEAEKIIGIDYKADYNGKTSGVRDEYVDKKEIVILGNDNAHFDHFDPHDLWHNRLSLVIDRSKVNKPVDEGCAYLYGGSWGFSWKEIFKEFKQQIASNKNTDWAAIKENDVRFKTGDFTNSADYVVNALLVQKIEQEKGFAGVWELLNVGPAEKGNEKYYQTLEKLTGISKANYNEKVWELIDNENKNLFRHY